MVQSFRDHSHIDFSMVQSFRDHSLHRMGVVLMDKKTFDFKDLMAFGMFILALLTFVFANLK